MGIVSTGVRAERAFQPKWRGRATAVDTLAGIVRTPITALDHSQKEPRPAEMRGRARRRRGECGAAMEQAVFEPGACDAEPSLVRGQLWDLLQCALGTAGSCERDRLVSLEWRGLMALV